MFQSKILVLSPPRLGADMWVNPPDPPALLVKPILSTYVFSADPQTLCSRDKSCLLSPAKFLTHGIHK
jgi:hypothetical protein